MEIGLVWSEKEVDQVYCRRPKLDADKSTIKARRLNQSSTRQ